MTNPFESSILREDVNEFASLVDSGIDLNTGGCYGNPPIYGVIIKQNLEMLRMLLRNGADPDITLNGGGRPIFVAINRRGIDIIRELIWSGVDIGDNVLGHRNFTPLQAAIDKGNPDIIQEILVGLENPLEQILHGPCFTRGDMIRGSLYISNETRHVGA